MFVTHDRLDSELLKHLLNTTAQRQYDAHSGHVIKTCMQHPCMKLVMQRKVPHLRVKSREWVIRIDTDASGRISNFAATRKLDAVWARPKDRTNIVGISSEEAFRDFIHDHYDVLVYYYASLDPETMEHIFAWV